jgi:predicted nucleotide-binding protein (sugar kinase/HSP70/actin superfamily)
VEKIKIGIPRGLLYYKYGDLWENFFHELGFEVVTSPETNKSILSKGQSLAIDESCLSMKIYLGHVAYLIDKVDYILVPRICSLYKKEKMCTNFQALYDIVNNIFDIKIINYNVDVEKGATEKKAFMKMGKNLEKKRKQIKNAYYRATRIAKRKKEHRLIKQERLLKGSTNLKILLVSHSYNMYDHLIGKVISKLLNELEVEVIYADIFDRKKIHKKYQEISKKVYWTYSKELLGSIIHYYDFIDGFILLSVFPCGPDSLTNEMCIRKMKNKPIINIIIDELTGEAGLQTRIESFVDIIKQRKEKEVKINNEENN